MLPSIRAIFLGEIGFNVSMTGEPRAETFFRDLAIMEITKTNTAFAKNVREEEIKVFKINLGSIWKRYSKTVSLRDNIVV